MDYFTDKANSILKPLRENVVYSSEEEECKTTKKPEEDAETTTTIDEPGFLNKKSAEAINIAQKLATNAPKTGIYGFRSDPQVEVNKAYSNIMLKLAKRLKAINI
jgi:hypothetical protein